MHKQLQFQDLPVNLAPLNLRFELALERLGKASRFQFGDAVCWEIHSPHLLSGMRAAAEMSLKNQGCEDVDFAVACALEAYPSNPFLALRGLLGEEMLRKLVKRFEKELEDQTHAA